MRRLLSSVASWAHSRRVMAVAVAVVLLSAGVGSGSAYAYWRQQGSGSGVANTGTAQSVTVQVLASGTPSTKLVPNGTTADLIVQLSNPNSYAVTLVRVAQNTSDTVDVTGATGCTGGTTGGNTGVSVPTLTGLSISVPGNTVNGGVNVIHIPNGVTMSASSASGCQGASFKIPVTLTVQK